MHPILFKIPLPTRTIAITWILLAVAGIAAIFALVNVARKMRQDAVVPGLIAAAAGAAAIYFRGQTWDAGPVPIYSYGVMLGLSLVVGWYLTLGLAERDGLPKETMANNYVVTAIAAVAGSRVLYILTNLHEFNSLGDMLAMRKGGLVAYGGFLGGLAGSFFFLRRHKIPLLPWADVAVPSLASGLMITRIGCYLFGCDFGQPLKETAPGWLKTLGSFPHWADGTLEHGSGSPAWVQHVQAGRISQSATHSLPVHPTQIYESLVGASLLALLLLSRRKQKFRGQIFFLFAFAYGVCRYLLEVLRDDAERGSIPPALPEHVLIPLGLAVLALGYVIGFSKAIQNVVVQRVTQVAAFIPAIAMYLALKPETFAQASTVQYSTSQFIAITSGFAASVAFAVFYKAALMHPKQAMALGVPAPAGAPPEAAADAVADEDDDEEERPAPKPVAKTKKKKKGSPKGQLKMKLPTAEKKADDDEAEEAPAAKKDDAEDDEAPAAEKGASDDEAETKAEKKAKASGDDEES